MSESGSFSELVLELAEEFIERCRRGERPRLSEYIRKYPHLESQIRDVFPTMAMLEKIAIDDDSLDQKPTRSTAPELRQVGDYRIIREVGRGGMGVVYEAEQVSLGRRVAVKVLASNVFSDDRVRKRFARESRAAARLHHTNIVPVFGVGELDNLQYYVMQFIQGLGLDQVLLELRRLKESAPSVLDQLIPQQDAEEAGRPELPVGEEQVAADSMARSLMSGRFLETHLIPACTSGDVSDQESDFNNIKSVALAGSSTPKHERTGNDNPLARDETVTSAAADTARSWEMPRPGQSQVTGSRSTRIKYWRSVANIGVQVAEALHHAHQQGVIHRDIKPANLLMDTRGNVWVTDFGLAKASDQHDLTHTGDILGTLRYMAPEQFEGHSNHLTDTYSLGLTLYELLVLQPAFPEKDRHRLMKQVTSEAPPALRSVDPQLPLDLATIVQKSIDRDPHQRYQSAQELAEDLQRFLSDEPILARRISLSRRFVRWCKRNPLVASLITAVAMLLSVVAVGSSLAAVRFEGLAKQKDGALVDATRARQQAQKALTQAELSTIAAEKARDQEVLLRKEAEVQRERAGKNFRFAREAVDKYLAKITEDELLSVPGLQPLRKDLLNEALLFYKRLEEEQAENNDLKLDLATARFRLGVIQRELGDSDAASISNKAAIEQLELLLPSGLVSFEQQKLLASAYHHDRRFDDAIRICSNILQVNPKDPATQSILAEVYNSLATETLDEAMAMSHHQKAFQFREILVNSEPDNSNFNGELGGTLNNIGVLLFQLGQHQEALAMYEKACGYTDRAYELSPQSITWGKYSAINHGNAGNILFNRGQFHEALTHYAKVVDIRKQLVSQNPSLNSLRVDLYQDLFSLANLQRTMGAVTESNRSFRDARDLMIRIKENTPNPVELATVYAKLASVPARNVSVVRDQKEAEDERQRNADEGIRVLREAVKNGLIQPSELQGNLSLKPFFDRKDFQELVRSNEQAAQAKPQLVDESQQPVQPDPDQETKAKISELKSRAFFNKEWAVQADASHSIGVIQTGLRKFDDAEESLKKALQLRQTMLIASSGDSRTELAVLATHVAMGQLDWARGQYPEAHRIFNDCLDSTWRLANLNSTDSSLQQEIAGLERSICWTYAQSGIWNEAVLYPKRNVLLNRLTDSITDARFAYLLGLQPNKDDAYIFTRRFNEHLAGTGFVNMLVWVNTLLAEPLTDRSNTVRMLEQELNEGRWQTDWNRMGLALALLRTEQPEKALEALNSLKTPERRFITLPIQVLVYSALKQNEKVDELRSRVDSSYKKIVTEALTSPDVTLLFSDLIGDNTASTTAGTPASLWFEVAKIQIILNEMQMIKTSSSQYDDPWQHLIQARGYHLIGELEKAETELASAIAATPNDPDVRTAIARLMQRWQKDVAAVESAWAKAIEVGPTDPLPLIRRGRWYAERGELEKAKKDYADGAGIDTHHVGDFLNAGWWVGGLCEDDLAESTLENLQPDPSQPASLKTTEAFTTPRSITWSAIPTGDLKRLDLVRFTESNANDKESSGSAFYALNHIYSPAAASVDLRVSSKESAHIWINGELCTEFVPDVSPEEETVETTKSISLALRQGLNVILVRGIKDSGLTVEAVK